MAAQPGRNEASLDASALERLANPAPWHVMPSRDSRRREREAQAAGPTLAPAAVYALRQAARRRPGIGARTALDEDVFERSLSVIIQREYFPDLPQLEQQLAWVEALESGDARQLADAERWVEPRYRRTDAIATPAPEEAPQVAPLTVASSSSSSSSSAGRSRSRRLRSPTLQSGQRDGPTAALTAQAEGAEGRSALPDGHTLDSGHAGLDPASRLLDDVAPESERGSPRPRADDPARGSSSNSHGDGQDGGGGRGARGAAAAFSGSPQHGGGAGTRRQKRPRAAQGDPAPPRPKRAAPSAKAAGAARALQMASDPTVSLSRFLAEFESEADASFRRTEERRAAERRERLWWVYERHDSAARLMQSANPAHRGALRALLDQRQEQQRLRDAGVGRLNLAHVEGVSAGWDRAPADTVDAAGGARTPAGHRAASGEGPLPRSAPPPLLLGAASTHRPRNQLFFQPELSVSNDVCNVSSGALRPSAGLLAALTLATGSTRDAVSLARQGSSTTTDALLLANAPAHSSAARGGGNGGSGAALTAPAASSAASSSARSAVTAHSMQLAAPAAVAPAAASQSAAARTSGAIVPWAGTELRHRTAAGGADGLPAADALVRWVEPSYRLGDRGQLIPPRVLQKRATRLDPSSAAAKALRDPLQAALMEQGRQRQSFEDAGSDDEAAADGPSGGAGSARKGARAERRRGPPGVPVGLLPAGADLHALAELDSSSGQPSATSRGAAPGRGSQRVPERLRMPALTPLPVAVVGGSGVPCSAVEALGPVAASGHNPVSPADLLLRGATAGAAPLGALRRPGAIVLPLDPPVTWGILVSDPVLLGPDGDPLRGPDGAPIASLEQTLAELQRLQAPASRSAAGSAAASPASSNWSDSERRSVSRFSLPPGAAPAFAAGADAGASPLRGMPRTVASQRSSPAAPAQQRLSERALAARARADALLSAVGQGSSPGAGSAATRGPGEVSEATERRTAELQRELAALRQAASSSRFRVPGPTAAAAALQSRRARSAVREEDRLEAARLAVAREAAAANSAARFPPPAAPSPASRQARRRPGGRTGAPAAAAGSRGSFAASLRASYGSLRSTKRFRKA